MAPRIVTLTLNPAVDLACTAPAVRHTHKIRTFGEQLDPGGGGINAARVLHVLGGDVLALIMTGGATGHMIEELLTDDGVRWQSIPIRGRNRISLNVHDQQSNLEYRFVPEGPVIEPEEWTAAESELERIEADWIIASGSLPRGVPVDFYARAAAIAARRGQNFVLDTSGPALAAAASFGGIDLLKLSLGELEYLVNHPLSSAIALEREVANLLRAGTAKAIAVSLGADGAILGRGDRMTRLPALSVRERGAVGAGDSFLAALVLGLARGLPDRNALGFAMAAGAAAVSTYGTARIGREDVESRYLAWCRADEP